MIKVNLVPADILAKAQQKQQLFQLGVVGAGVLVLVILVSVGHFTKAVQLEAEQKRQEAEYAKWQEEVKLIENLEKQAAELRRRLNVVSDLLKGRPLYAKFMTDVARTLPGGVWLKSVTTTSSGNAVKTTTIAEAASPEDIREWVRRMEESGRFSAIEIGAVSASAAVPRIFAFTMTCAYAAEL